MHHFDCLGLSFDSKHVKILCLLSQRFGKLNIKPPTLTGPRALRTKSQLKTLMIVPVAA